MDWKLRGYLLDGSSRQRVLKKFINMRLDMRYRSVFAIGLICLATGCSPSLQDLGGKPSANLSDGDNDFFKKITGGNETEIQSSRMALTQSQNQQVRDFAQHMIDDHMIAEQRVGGVAATKGVTLPSQLDSKHQGMVDNLKNKSGADFDKAYVDLQVNAHKEAVSFDQDEATNGNDAQVKELANELLGSLQMHLQMAQKLQSSM